MIISQRPEQGNRHASLPAGRAAFERSQMATAGSNCSIIRGEMPSLGMISAAESMVFVGAAKRVAGARARMTASVFVKIMMDIVNGFREIG
jgi:hypothetical protein